MSVRVVCKIEINLSLVHLDFAVCSVVDDRPIAFLLLFPFFFFSATNYFPLSDDGDGDDDGDDDGATDDVLLLFLFFDLQFLISTSYR